jgi:hypothetical protein
MKKNQNPIPKPSFALPMFNRGLKLMALALVSLVAGVGNTNAQTPAVVGRVIFLTPSLRGLVYLNHEQYADLISMRNTTPVIHEILETPVQYYRNELITWHPVYGNRTFRIQDLTLTNNGLKTKFGYFYRGGSTLYYQYGYFAASVRADTSTGYASTQTFIDFNELEVNRAMSAAPIGTLKVTPSNSASEQTMVRWSVE